MLYDLELENLFRETDMFDINLSIFFSSLPKAALREFILDM